MSYLSRFKYRLKNPNQNNRRLLTFLLFIFMMVFFDQIIGLIMRHRYFDQKNNTLTYDFSQCKNDILIFGNSRAQHHYISKTLSDSLKLTCFNVGQDGGHSILLSYAQIKIITSRYSPKIIILEFDPEAIVHYTGDYDRLSVLLPYYKEYPQIQSIILLRSKFERLKLMSAIYPFNSKLNTNLMNIIRSFSNTKAFTKQINNGYIPLEGVMRNNLLKFKQINTSQTNVDSNMFNAPKDIINLCSNKNIKLYIFNSPVFHSQKEKKDPPSPAGIKSLEIISHNKIHFVDFSYDSTFMDHSELFKDKAHLNREGAKVYSNLIVKEIKLTQ